MEMNLITDGTDECGLIIGYFDASVMLMSVQTNRPFHDILFSNETGILFELGKFIRIFMLAV